MYVSDIFDTLKIYSNFQVIIEGKFSISIFVSNVKNTYKIYDE